MGSHDTLEQIRMLNKESQAGLLFCYKALKIYGYDYQQALAFLKSDRFKRSFLTSHKHYLTGCADAKRIWNKATDCPPIFSPFLAAEQPDAGQSDRWPLGCRDKGPGRFKARKKDPKHGFHIP